MLSQKEIKKIYSCLQQRGLKYYDLQLELTDHIATSIELRKSIEPELQFESLLKIEFKNWESDKTNNLIRTKRKFLKRYWTKRATKYFLDYFKIPKIILFISLTILFTAALSYGNIRGDVIQIFVYAAFTTGFLSMIYSSYINYKSSHSEPPPLLTYEAYSQTVLSIISVFYILYFIYNDQSFIEPIKFPNLFWGLLMTTYIICLHASLFVFPKWIKEETIKQYKHLGTL